MRVAACIVTRGNVPLDEITESLPAEWEVIVWDNSQREDLVVYGRYAAIELTDAEVIYVQDDDCVLEPAGHGQLLGAWQYHHEQGSNVLVSNMPARFRHDFYSDSCLVGFGAIFHRDLPATAFSRFAFKRPEVEAPFFYRECDLVFTGLTPRVLVDADHRDLPWASDPDRLWKQRDHVGQRSRMLELVREVRNA